MPNIVDANGLTTKTQQELVDEMSAELRDIYGTDINLEPSTPDGQMMMIYIQGYLDALDMVRQVYNGFDPDLAIGRVLDQRVGINGIQRQAGTRTITDITIVTNAPVTLWGVDTAELNGQDIYTVADNAGNEFELIATESVGGAGSHVMLFRAKVAGEVLTIPNTITVPVTIVLGVVSINNPSTYTTLGINEESDQDLRIRRQKSVSFASQGYYASLIAALENIPEVNYAAVYENVTGSTDGDGIPSHSIWVIVSGGAAEDIAQAIYKKRNAGCGMKGSETYTITQVDGSPFVIRWDEVVSEDLYIEFDASSLNGIDAPNTAAILAQLPDLLDPGVYEQVNINDLATLVQQIDPNTLVTNAGFSTSGSGPWTNTLKPTTKNKKFSVTSGNINITVV